MRSFRGRSSGLKIIDYAATARLQFSSDEVIGYPGRGLPRSHPLFVPHLGRSLDPAARRVALRHNPSLRP